MQRLKGKADPSLNKAGQLRYDFLAPNRCLSLMHSSDSLAQVRREAAVFFTAGRIEAACAAARAAVDGSGALMTELADASSESGIERVEEPRLGTLFARVRLRLSKDLPSLLSWDALLLSYRALWEPMSKGSARGPVMAEAREYLQLVAREGPLLDAVVTAVENAVRGRIILAEYYRPSAQEPVSLVRCLQVLHNPEAYSRWNSDLQLPQHALHDRWERLLFRTHLFNFDDLLSASGSAA
jgi:hypothetical protein